MPRYFVYQQRGRRYMPGLSGKIYYFEYGVPTPVVDDDDAEYFLHIGTPENGVYMFKETDIDGNPVGPFPPVNELLRQSIIDTRRFPTDRGETARERRYNTEDMGDPVMYFHVTRRKRWKSEV